MEITIERLADVAVLRCRGSLDAETVATFRRTTQSLCQQGTSRFVLDGSELDFIDSMGLGVLISLLRRVRPQDGEVKLSALTPDVRQVFEITRLHRLFDICATTAQACQRFAKGPAAHSPAR